MGSALEKTTHTPGGVGLNSQRQIKLVSFIVYGNCMIPCNIQCFEAATIKAQINEASLAPVTETAEGIMTN